MFFLDYSFIHYSSPSGWLTDSDILDITQDGSYTINSLSTNSGVRAARIILGGNFRPIWLEWRTAVNQDVGISEGEWALKQWDIPQPGKAVNSILMKVALPNSKGGRRSDWTATMAMIDPGKSASTSSGVTVTAEVMIPGGFKVSGLVNNGNVPTASSSSGNTGTPTPFPPSVCAKGKVNRFAGASTSASKSRSDKNEGFKVLAVSGKFYQVRSCRNSKMYYLQISDTNQCAQTCA